VLLCPPEEAGGRGDVCRYGAPKGSLLNN